MQITKDKVIVTNDDKGLIIRLECNTTKLLVDSLKQYNPKFDVKEELENNVNLCYDFINELNDFYISEIDGTLDILAYNDERKRTEQFNKKYGKINTKRPICNNSEKK